MSAKVDKVVLVTDKIARRTSLKVIKHLNCRGYGGWNWPACWRCDGSGYVIVKRVRP